MFEHLYADLPKPGESRELFPRPAHERVIERLAAEWAAESKAMAAAALRDINARLDVILVFAKRSAAQRRRFARYKKIHEGETQ